MSRGMHNRARLSRAEMSRRIVEEVGVSQAVEEHARVLAKEIEGMDRESGFGVSDVQSMLSRSLSDACRSAAKAEQARMKRSLLGLLGIEDG